jgi:hypothetical protein
MQSRQTLWKSWSQRRSALWSALPCYIFLYLFPTGFFSAAANNVMFFVCRPDPTQPRLGISSLRWFCDARLLQFVFTVVVPFILLMIWQNAIIPAVRRLGFVVTG